MQCARFLRFWRHLCGLVWWRITHTRPVPAGMQPHANVRYNFLALLREADSVVVSIFLSFARFSWSFCGGARVGVRFATVGDLLRFVRSLQCQSGGACMMAPGSCDRLRERNFQLRNQVLHGGSQENAGGSFD